MCSWRHAAVRPAMFITGGRLRVGCEEVTIQLIDLLTDRLTD